ncbi:unnamed protein product, partial [Allacma fusca]
NYKSYQIYMHEASPTHRNKNNEANVVRNELRISTSIFEDLDATYPNLVILNLDEAALRSELFEQNKSKPAKLIKQQEEKVKNKEFEVS